MYSMNDDNFTFEDVTIEGPNELAHPQTEGPYVRSLLIAWNTRNKVSNNDGIQTLVGQSDIIKKRVVDERDRKFNNDSEQGAPTVDEGTLKNVIQNEKDGLPQDSPSTSRQEPEAITSHPQGGHYVVLKR